MSSANDWWTPSQSTSSPFLGTPTRQPATSGAVRPLFGSTSTPARGIATSLDKAHTTTPGANHVLASSHAQGTSGKEYKDELDEADARLADSVNFGPIAPTGAVGRSSHGHGYGASPGRAGIGSSMGYSIGTPGQGGPSSPGGYASSPLAGVAGIGSPGGKRSPGGRFGSGGLESGSSPRDQRRRTMQAAYQDEDLPPTASLRDLPGGGDVNGSRFAQQPYNPSNSYYANESSESSRSNGHHQYNNDPHDASPSSSQVQNYQQPERQIGQAIHIIDRNVLRAAPVQSTSGWSIWPFGNGAGAGASAPGSAVGTTSTAGGAGTGGPAGWKENKSTAGWVLGVLIGS